MSWCNGVNGARRAKPEEALLPVLDGPQIRREGTDVLGKERVRREALEKAVIGYEIVVVGHSAAVDPVDVVAESHGRAMPIGVHLVERRIALPVRHHLDDELTERALEIVAGPLDRRPASPSCEILQDDGPIGGIVAVAELAGWKPGADVHGRRARSCFVQLAQHVEQRRRLAETSVVS